MSAPAEITPADLAVLSSQTACWGRLFTLGWSCYLAGYEFVKLFMSGNGSNWYALIAVPSGLLAAYIATMALLSIMPRWFNSKPVTAGRLFAWYLAEDMRQWLLRLPNVKDGTEASLGLLRIGLWVSITTVISGFVNLAVGLSWSLDTATDFYAMLALAAGAAYCRSRLSEKLPASTES